MVLDTLHSSQTPIQHHLWRDFRSTSSHKELISVTHLAFPNKEILLGMFIAAVLSTITRSHPFQELALLPEKTVDDRSEI